MPRVGRRFVMIPMNSRGAPLPEAISWDDLPRTRRPGRGLRNAVAVVLAVTLVGVVSALSTRTVDAGAPLRVEIVVDFGAVVMRTDPGAVGLVSSTYGLTPVSSNAQRDAERRLDARWVRIPVGYRNGVVTSSAAGAAGVDVAQIIAVYRGWGFRVMAVIGGRTTDVDVRPGDATAIIRALGTDGLEYSAPNEPGNQGQTVQQQIATARMIADEGRALSPGFRLWGPVWSYYEKQALVTYATAMGDRLAGIDYHHYAMGERSVSTVDAMAGTPRYAAEVSELRAELAARGISVPVAVDELNLSWRYQDGTPGGNNRFFSAVNTVWTTSALGHILRAGGRGMVYASQNGPLGLTVEPDQFNPDGRGFGSPMPSYWGVANWTGGTRFPHFKDSFYAVSGAVATTEVFAVNNEAGGRNLLLLNKSESASVDVTARLDNITPGSFTEYRNDPSVPYAVPAPVGSGSYDRGGTVTRTLPPMTVTVLVLTPRASTAVPPPVTAVSATTTGATATVTWLPPGAGMSGVRGFRVGRDGTDSTGGGVWTTELAADRRSFTFTLLRPTTRYTFTVQTLGPTGAGTPVTVTVTTN